MSLTSSDDYFFASFVDLTPLKVQIMLDGILSSVDAKQQVLNG